MPEKKYFEDLITALNQYKNSGYRAIVHISGKQAFCIEQANQLIDDTHFEKIIWLGSANDAPHYKSVQTPPQLKKLLGTEIDILVINAYGGFNPCAIGIASGCIKAGGMLILLSPEDADWVDYADPDYERMVSDHKYISVIKGRFIQHALDCLTNNHAIWRIAQSSLNLQSGYVPQEPFVRNYKEQKNAIYAIKRVITGHARRPLVLQADRGRGKSAALGIAAAQLMQDHALDIIVTAPDRDAVNTLFKHAAKQLNIDEIKNNTLVFFQSTLCFIPVDKLLKDSNLSNILFIDEAAAIPAAILKKLLKRFNRIVFSTTVHGYEGSGRGFAVRFRDVLDNIMPQWRFLEMHTPIRWAAGDSLERLCNEMLLLQAVPPQIITSGEISFSFIDRDDLLHDKTRLQQLFGLLVTAHYQTSPDDLRILLDHPDVAIVIAEIDSKIIAVALVMREGNFNDESCQSLINDKRRVRGHLIPQAMAVSGFNEVLKSHFLRIVRIAVQAEMQGQGIGQELVKYIELHSKADFLGASFSAEPAVINFWKKTGMQVVRLGVHKESTTGEYACIVLKSLCGESIVIYKNMIQSFVTDITYQLLTTNRDMPPETVIQLLKGLPFIITEKDRIQCRAYVNQQRNFETVQVSLLRTVLSFFDNNSQMTEANATHLMMVQKLLLNHSWKEVCEQYSFTGKKTAESALRQEILLLLKE